MLRALTLILTLLISTSECFADQIESGLDENIPASFQWLWGAGIQTSSYKYARANTGAFRRESRGAFYRFNGYLSLQFYNFHLTTELTYGFGSIDYHDSLRDQFGTLSNKIPDVEYRLREYRLLLGRSFQLGRSQIVPATGLGVRQLDDLGGDLVRGHDRHSKYTYIPIRTQYILPLSHETYPPRLSVSFEYDHFLGGIQETDFADAFFPVDRGDTLGLVMGDVTNDQNGGSGFRFSLAWDFATQPDRFNTQLSIYYESWKIDRSEQSRLNVTTIMRDPVADIVNTRTYVEPENRTREIGVTLRLTRF